MTTYQYTIVLNSSEAIALKAALNLLIEHCEQNLEQGPRAPFWAHKYSAENILKRLYLNTSMVSTNTFK